MAVFSKAEPEKPQGQTPPSFVDATASSELEPSEGFTFTAGNVLNDSTRSAWDEGVAGDGVGQWIQVTANGPQLVQGVRIINGAPVSEHNYWNNNRVRRIRVELSDGYAMEYELSDTYDWQSVSFDAAHATSYIKFTILSVYHGERYDDTCITAIKAF